MPATDNTPAPSRRFLPPSSAATSTSSIGASARRNPFQVARNHASNILTSPLTQSQRFNTPSRPRRDEIQGSFEDAPSSPALPVQRLAFKYGTLRHDAMDDVEDEEAYKSTRSAQASTTGQDVDEGASSEDCTAEDHVDEVNMSDGQLTTPAPKRRKLLSQSNRLRTLIDPLPSTSDHSDVDDVPDNPELDASLLESSSPNDAKSNIVPDPVLHQPTSRFKTRVTRIMDEDVPHLRPSFKPVDAQDESHTPVILPDAFSPSRRKGRRDYEPGGLADTVRGWILSAATEESQNSNKGEVVLQVDHVENDPSGRTVSCIDNTGQQWLLVGQRRGPSGESGTGRVEIGNKVIVKGLSTQWSIPVKGINGADIRVAAHWELT